MSPPPPTTTTTQKTFCLNDQAQIAWFTSTRGVYWSSPQYGTIWYSTVQYSTVQYGMVWYGMVLYGRVWYSTVQRVDFYFTMGTKCAKGQKIKRSKCHRGSLRVRSSQEHISSKLVSWRRSILFYSHFLKWDMAKNQDIQISV